MNKKLKTLVSLAGFALFIALAVFAYQRLGDRVKPGSALNVIDAQPQAAQTDAPAESAAEETAAPEETAAASEDTAAAPEAAEQAATEQPQAAPSPAEAEATAAVSGQAQAQEPARTEEVPAAGGEAQQAAAAETAAPQETEQTERPRTKAPDFSVQDMNGNSVKLSDFLGKPVVINFWASWCPPCKAEMPEFDKVHQELGGEVQFMMVDLVDGQRETRDKGAGYVEEMGYGFPVFFDMDQSAAITYGVATIPTTYFIDAEGYLVAGAQSAIDAETLKMGIGMIQ